MMSRMILGPVVSKSEQETVETGETFARQLKPGDVVLLYGELGAGKTRFVKGVARFFGVPEEEVQSPTFSLVHEYAGNIPLFHLDGYRIRHAAEVREFGLDEYLYAGGICLIEWPQVMHAELPQRRWEVTMVHRDEWTREISVHQKD